MNNQDAKLPTSSVPVRSLDATAFAEHLELLPDIWARIQSHNLRNVIPLRNAILESNNLFLPDNLGKRKSLDSLGDLGGKWLTDEVDRMIDDYERYMLVLRLVDGAFLAPTLAIDYVWHAHLKFATHYFDVWCSEVLGMSILHHPGLGRGPELVDAYQRFRKYHTKLFGFPPQEKWELFRPFNPKSPINGYLYEVTNDGSVVLLGDCG